MMACQTQLWTDRFIDLIIQLNEINYDLGSYYLLKTYYMEIQLITYKMRFQDFIPVVVDIHPYLLKQTHEKQVLRDLYHQDKKNRHGNTH